MWRNFDQLIKNVLMGFEFDVDWSAGGRESELSN